MKADSKRHSETCHIIKKIPVDGASIVEQKGKGRGLVANRNYKIGDYVVLYTAKARDMPTNRTNDDIRYNAGPVSQMVDGDFRQHMGTGPGSGLGYLVNDPLPFELINSLNEAKNAYDIHKWVITYESYRPLYPDNLKIVHTTPDTTIMQAIRNIKKDDELSIQYTTGYWIGMAGIEAKTPEARLSAILYTVRMCNASPYAFLRHNICCLPDRTSKEILAINKTWPSIMQRRTTKLDVFAKLLSDSNFVEKNVVNKWLKVLGSDQTGWTAWNTLYNNVAPLK